MVRKKKEEKEAAEESNLAAPVINYAQPHEEKEQEKHQEHTHPHHSEHHHQVHHEETNSMSGLFSTVTIVYKFVKNILHYGYIHLSICAKYPAIENYIP